MVEMPVRLGAFAAVFAILVLLERLAPRRAATSDRKRRWAGNLGLLAIDTAAVRIIAPGAAIAVAFAAQASGWGLVNTLPLPGWIAFALSVALLDLAIYLQHVMFHAVPTLWRLHRVHHSDVDFDLTTGVRFHPIEIAVSVAIKSAAVAAIGASPAAVISFEILLNAASLFNHANLRMPHRLDALLRWLVVTPDMHRVHHSVRYNESSSNFGFCLPWWDRLCGTYRAQADQPHETMTIGVDAFREADEERLDRLLTQPWRDTAGGYSINRRPEAGQGS
jgi:sterol desaturase/sphingolipid hydroxylase (fatty acid hydroxylase superfamily)